MSKKVGGSLAGEKPAPLEEKERGGGVTEKELTYIDTNRFSSYIVVHKTSTLNGEPEKIRSD